MSIRRLMTSADLDAMLRHRLKLSVQRELPPHGFRRRLLRAALNVAAPGRERLIPEHLVAQYLPGEYRDIQHRLSVRALVYTTPFGTAAFGLLN